MDFFIDAIEFNKDLPFTQILTCVVIYFVLFWFAVSVWVYRDAQRRYVNSDPRTPILIAFMVFILFFPALVFYLAIRPSDNDLDFVGYGDGGVNVPIVNFVGKDGISMSLEINIHKSPEQIKSLNGMRLDVSWDSDNKDMQIVSKQEGDEKTKSEFWIKVDEKLSVIKEKVQNIKSKIKNKNESSKKKANK